MTSHNFDPKFVPLHPCHSKMGVLPTPSNIVSQKYIPPPPTCVMSFMNGPLSKMNELCPVHKNLQKASAEDINWKRMKEKDICLSCTLRKVYLLYKKCEKL